MGAATGGAIGGSAGAATGAAGAAGATPALAAAGTIGSMAAGMSPIGLALTGVDMGMNIVAGVKSFQEAKNQKRLIAEANQQAEKALAEAKKELEKNYYKGLAVPMQAYNLESQALASAGAQATEAAAESERGVAATAGKIYAAQAEAQAKQRAALAEDVFNIDKLVAAEDSRLAGLRKDINLKEVEGYQQQMSDAEKARARYIEQGFSSLQGAVKTGTERFLPLYERQQEEKKAKAKKGFTPEQAAASQAQYGRSIGNAGFSAVGDILNMPGVWNAFMVSQQIKAAEAAKPNTGIVPDQNQNPYYSNDMNMFLFNQ